MNPPLIILGGGGHAKVLAEALLRTGRDVLGFTDPDPAARLLADIPYLGPDGVVFDHAPESVQLVNGLGSVGDNRPRQALFSHFTAKAYRFAEVRHPTAIPSSRALETGQGSQLLAGSVIGPGTRLGDNVLINTRAVVEHDCQVGNHVHISPGAIICGGCSIGDGAYIGAGAVVIQGIDVGRGTIVAAGSVVITNVEPLTLIAGVPGKPKRTLDDKDLAGYRP
jgi:UDP-perosamine 4-acetyltransferase